MPGHQPGHEPQLQRHVGRTVLHRGQADMVMAIDEPRQYHLAPGADHRDTGLPRRELGKGADLGDDAIALQYRAVIDLLPMTAVGRFGDHGQAATMLEGTFSLLKRWRRFPARRRRGRLRRSTARSASAAARPPPTRTGPAAAAGPPRKWLS